VSLVAGWYDDPSHAGRWRWWDGQVWTTWVRVDQPRLDEQHRFSRPALGRGWTLLAALAQLGLTLYLLVAGAAFALGWLMFVELGTGQERPRAMDQATIDTVVTYGDPLVTAGVVVTLATGVVFIAWLFRAHRSNRMSAGRLQRASGWAIGGWFVPFVNLVMPALVVQDVNRASRPWQQPPGAGLVTCWWVALVGSSVLGRLVGEPDTALPMREYLAELREGVGLGLVADGLGLVAAVLGIVLVRRLTDQVRASPFGPQASEPATEPAAD